MSADAGAGPVLVVSAHAGDFVWRAGGAMALASSRGAQVMVLCLSFGERGELPPRRTVALHVQLGVDGIAIHERAAHGVVDHRFRRWLDVFNQRRVAIDKRLHALQIVRLTE